MFTNMRTFFFCFQLILLLTASPVYASGTLDSLQKKYNVIKSMKASFTQVLYHKESGAKENRTGVLLFKKPLLVKWETKDPAPELLVVNKSEIWNVFPDEDIAYKYPLSIVEDSRNILRVITGQSQLEQDFIVDKEERVDNLIRLDLIPKEPVQALVEAVFWVDPKTSLVRKFQLTDFYGNINEIQFTDISLDVSIKDNEFGYKPASGMQVEDRTVGGEEPVMQKPLLQ